MRNEPYLSRMLNKVKLFRWGIIILVCSLGGRGLAFDLPEQARKALTDFDQRLSLQDKKNLIMRSFSDPENFSPSFRKLARERQILVREVQFWDQVKGLQQSLMALSLPYYLDGKQDQNRSLEAGLIAKTSIERIQELKGKYQMIRPALLHNIFVNVGLKKEGLCWQWTRDLMSELMKLDLHEYDLQWVTAHEGAIGEHNSVVVMSRGTSWEEGIIIDGWRNSGKPFWTKVKKDHYPWKKGDYEGE